MSARENELVAGDFKGLQEGFLRFVKLARMIASGSVLLPAMKTTSGKSRLDVLDMADLNPLANLRLIRSPYLIYWTLVGTPCPFDVVRVR
jgi:hypothetical protein